MEAKIAKASANCSGTKKKQYRIAMILPTLAGIGGSVRMGFLLAEHLAKQGHQVLLLGRNEGISQNSHPNIICQGLKLQETRPRHLIKEAYKPLKAIFKENKIDLIFGIGTYETLIALAPAKVSKTPLIYCDHGALINQWQDKKMRLISWLNAKFSTRTVVLTERSKNDYQTLLKIKPAKVKVMPNWIPQSFIETGKTNKYDPEIKRLLWCGRLAQEKGVDLLLEIASEFLPKRPDWVWDIVGEADSEEVIAEFKKESINRGIAKQLRFLGRTNNMLEVYPNYAAVTLTSYREGLPLTLLEGLAFQLPLFSFDVLTGPAEIIQNRKNGVLLPCYDTKAYADALLEFTDNPALRAEMSAAAKHKISDFSEEKILADWNLLVAEVLADSR